MNETNSTMCDATLLAPFRFLANMFQTPMDYVQFTLTEPPPALPQPPRPFLMRYLLGSEKESLSLLQLDRVFQRIGDDAQAKGVILHLRHGQGWGLADLTTLRESIFSLRKRGKRVIAYSSTGYDWSTYYIASAADEILLQPMSIINVCGLNLSFFFLKDALASIGIQFDLIASHPYKTAGDSLSSDAPSTEFNEEYNKFLDSWFDIMLEGIAKGRNIKVEEARAMIDGGMHVDQEALQLGYIDGVLNEEQLPLHLGTKFIWTWDQAKKRLGSRDSWWQKSLSWSKYVALVRIDGVIGSGESSTSPMALPMIGTKKFTGDLTVIQQVRRLIRDKNAAALILYVDSPGGDGTASEAIAAALREFNKTRPVVVYMNNVAGSGGYLVSTPSRWIVAQPATVTGSVGAITGKLIDEGLLSKLRINRVTYSRGENVNMSHMEGAPFTDAQRKRRKEMLNCFYNQFAALVGKSRGMTQEQLDAACQGRIWTGQQALDCGLVDELGGLDVALKKARKLAKLPDDVPIMLIPELRSKTRIPPALVDPSTTLNHINTIVNTIGSGKPLLMMPHCIGFK